MKSENLQKLVLYDVEWQAMRVQLLASNNDYGGFGTVEGVKKNIAKLHEYVQESYGWCEHNLATSSKGCSMCIETYCRHWRVLNLLNATLLGYGSRYPVDDPRMALVIITRDQYSLLYRH